VVSIPSPLPEVDPLPQVESGMRLAGVLALALPAIVLFAAFMWLGFYVKAHPEPPALLAFAHAVRGHEIGLAWIFTNAGFASVLAPLYLLCIIAAIFIPSWRLPALFVVAVALIAWGVTDGLQHYFARPRRIDWLVRHERAFSYPSSHASISTDFYFLWGLVLLRSRLRLWIRMPAFVLLTLLTLGIVWSRLALGAHYPTDVLGGIILGIALMLFAAALLRSAGSRLFAR
jgi:membrane-associated phospholipid phosphatase